MSTLTATTNVTTGQPRTTTRRPSRLRWLAVLVTGAGLFGMVLAVLIGTGNPLYIPCLLLLGAAIVPATLTTFVRDVEGAHRISLERVLSAAVVGGVAGGVLAGLLEFDTLHVLGWLPASMIGLIEEAAKLAVPALLLIWWRPRPRPVDGLVLGVAVGSGFAAVETMGYAFVQLIRTGGNLEPVAQLLTVRAVSSLGGHAAWTGLACAALFAIGGTRPRWLGWSRFVLVFAGVAALHAQWDSTAGGPGYVEVAVLSFVLLLAVTWWLHGAGRRGREWQRRF